MKFIGLERSAPVKRSVRQKAGDTLQKAANKFRRKTNEEEKLNEVDRNPTQITLKKAVKWFKKSVNDKKNKVKAPYLHEDTKKKLQVVTQTDRYEGKKNGGKIQRPTAMGKLFIKAAPEVAYPEKYVRDARKGVLRKDAGLKPKTDYYKKAMNNPRMSQMLSEMRFRPDNRR
jgi:hypothetical protein